MIHRVKCHYCGKEMHLCYCEDGNHYSNPYQYCSDCIQEFKARIAEQLKTK